MSQKSVTDKEDDEINLAKNLMNRIDDGSQDQLPELFKIAHINPKVFVHCEKYFKMGIEFDIDKYECMNDYGLIQMLKGNDPSEYFKKSYEEGNSENGLFNYAVFTKRKDLLKESADKYNNSMAMLLYYQLTNDINYLKKSAVECKNPFALTLYGLYQIEHKLDSDQVADISTTSNENKNINIKKNEEVKENDNTKENRETNDDIKNEDKKNENNANITKDNGRSENSEIYDQNKTEEEEINDNNENITEEEEEESNDDDNNNDGQMLLTESAILTKPGDKYNLLPFPSALFYSKEFVNECRHNIKRAADSGNPHCAFLYAYMCTDLQEKSKYYKLAGDKGLSEGYFQYCKLVKKNSSLFSPGQFDSLPVESSNSPKTNLIEKVPSSSTENENEQANKKENLLNDSKEVNPSNFELEMNRFVGEMNGFIDFQRSIFDITINNVPTVSQNIVSTIVDVKSVYKLVHNIMLAVDFRPFEQNLNALANLSTSVHFLIFDEYLQNLFRDLLIQEACSNTSRNRSRFYFIELCIENFMFSMDYFCKAVSYIKKFRQNVNYNRYVELWFPEVHEFITKNEHETENDEETTDERNENEKEKESTEDKAENKKESTEDKAENESKESTEDKTENKKESTETKIESNDKENDDHIDLNYFFDTKEHIDDSNHNTQSFSKPKKEDEEVDDDDDNESSTKSKNSFHFLSFRDSTLVSSSFIKSHRKNGNPDPLSQAIRHDDINKFKHLLMQSKKANINTRIEPSFFELSSMLDKRPSLLCYCAFFNAEKCFSFLIDNEADTLVFDDECLTVSAYAAASGSTKILARLEAVNELDHQEAAEFASRFHRGRILKRLMNGKTMCGAVAEEMKENQISIANELVERQKRQMMQELQIRKILLQQQKFIQQQELINQRNMKLQQEEQKLKLERFLIQQQQKIRLQQEQQNKQQQQNSQTAENKENVNNSNDNQNQNENSEQSSKPNQPNENSNSKESTQLTTATDEKQIENKESNQNSASNSSQSQQVENQSQNSKTSNSSENQPHQSEPNQATPTKSSSLSESNRSESRPVTKFEQFLQSAAASLKAESSSAESSNSQKRSSFFGKYADLQKQVLLEQRKQQLIKQQQQEQAKTQAQIQMSNIQPQDDLSLPPALSRLVASQQNQQNQQSQDSGFAKFSRRQNPYRQEPVEERREEFIVRDGESKVDEIEKVIINGLLSDFVESLGYFRNEKSEQKSPKTSAKQKQNNNNDDDDDDEEEEEESNDNDDDDESEEDAVDDENDGLIPLFAEDLNGNDSSIFFKICELGNSGVVHFFNREIWKRMLIETVQGEERETVLTRLAAIGNCDMLDEILKIKEVKKLINIANLQGNTPIEVATVNKNQNIIEIFESFLNEE